MSNAAGKSLPASVSITVILACVLTAGALCYRARQNALAAVQDPARHGAWPCAPDALRFCPDVSAGDGRINRCLREHNLDLSAPCIDSLEEVDPSNAWDNVCREEIQTFC